jgi:hypothetical protein
MAPPKLNQSDVYRQIELADKNFSHVNGQA